MHMQQTYTYIDIKTKKARFLSEEKFYSVLN